MIDLEPKSDARAAILKSIRDQLAASAPHDATYTEAKAAHHGVVPFNRDPAAPAEIRQDNSHDKDAAQFPLDMFRENLEAVGGHCIVAHGEVEAARALTRIIAGLQTTPLRGRRIALSDAPVVRRLIRQAKVETDEIAVAASVAALFSYDVGITTAQAAIAETGTLVLESECERHRLVSLLPPVHVAIVEAASIYLTLGETLSAVRRSGPTKLSRTITFITGPSRTADIELTLAVGVHGPQELYVIVNDASEVIA